MACHRFTRTQVDPVCLPEIFISEYALNWSACTDKPLEPGSEPRPLEPGGHRGQAHCSEWLTPLHHWGRPIMYGCVRKFLSVWHTARRHMLSLLSSFVTCPCSLWTLCQLNQLFAILIVMTMLMIMTGSDAIYRLNITQVQDVLWSVCRYTSGGEWLSCCSPTRQLYFLRQGADGAGPWRPCSNDC